MKQRMIKVAAVFLVMAIGMATTMKVENNRYFDILKNIEIFTNLYKEVNTYYVDEIDPGELMRTGIDAMMASLDPFTNYISETDIEGYRFMTEGRYRGIGAQSRKIGDFVTITELYQDQPADKAGVKVGDQVIAVDGKDVVGKAPDQVNDILRGFPGTEVELTLRRPGQKGDIKLKLTRDEVNVPNVPYSGMVSDDYGYIALTTFTRDAGRNVANALKELEAANPDMKGVILDLRENGGGLLNEAVNVSNVFIPRGELVATTKGKVKDWDRSFKTTGQPIDVDIPLTVLINKNSASASEIVSGVFQDYDRGVLIGQLSYGKGLVQNTMDVGYNSKVKITTAKYYIPSQRCIQSVEYANGEPVHIADEKRTPFKTRNGRTVLDGGGVKPDVYIKKASEGGVIKGLIDQHLIFDFVTEYCLGKEKIAEVEDFHFTEFDKFVHFLSEKEFQYDSESESLLKKLQKASANEGFKFDSNIKNIQLNIEEAKKDEVIRHKEEIIDQIEKEIASRYYYQLGAIKMGLRNDAEIKEAIAVMSDPGRYNKILAKQ
ncbi:MAG: peptidase S41 [Saprospiraceae bacterium]|nr:MAG: peptidase S41 [Saprospiraceae bacterium]